MTLKQVGSNQTELRLHNGTRVFFSYETPVAAWIPAQGYVRTATVYSRTTSKHITSWAGKTADTVPQAAIEALVA